MKPIIDINKLTTIILNGEDSYEDGRHSFDYELLTRTLADLGIKINKDAAWEEQGRRGKIRYARNNARLTRSYPRYVFTVEGDWDAHINACLGENEIEFPFRAREHGHVVLDPEKIEGQHRWTYEADSRKEAAKLLGYIRAAHPDAHNLRLTVQ